MCACTAPACPLADKLGASGTIRGHATTAGWPDLTHAGFWLCPAYLAARAAAGRPVDPASLDPAGTARDMRAAPRCDAFRWIEVKMGHDGRRCAECRRNPLCVAAVPPPTPAKAAAAKRPPWRP
jgi:hypothetical protein